MLIRLRVLHVCVAEDREGEADHGEEPAEPPEVENVSQRLYLVPEGLQRSQPAAGAAPGVSQIHHPGLPSVLFLSSHRRTPFTARAATQASGFALCLFCGPWWVYGAWGGFVQLQQGYRHRRWSTLALDTCPAHVLQLCTKTTGSWSLVIKPEVTTLYHTVSKDITMDSLSTGCKIKQCLSSAVMRRLWSAQVLINSCYLFNLKLRTYIERSGTHSRCPRPFILLFHQVFDDLL